MGVENGEEECQDIMSESHVITRHYCKVCSRGFVSAGALGGHMRSHVMGDVIASSNPLAPCGDKTKHSYYLRAKTTTRLSLLGDRVDDEENGDKRNKPLSTWQSFEESEPVHREGASNVDPAGSTVEEEDLANCLVMLSSDKCSSPASDKGKDAVELNNKGAISFRCKACKKVFGSHQALGGHRASHKKVKGCFAAKLDSVDEGINHVVDGGDPVRGDQQDHEYCSYSPSDMTVSTKKSRAKMHECSVCWRVFSSGQALGGHKRCHWLTTSSSSDTTFIPNFQYDHHHHHHQSQHLYKKPMITKPNHQDHDHQELDLNLNLPVPQHDQHHAQRNNDDHETSKSSTRLYPEQWSTSSAYLNQQQEKTDKGRDQVKLQKLSDLRDVNLDGGWLQMGFTSF